MCFVDVAARYLVAYKNQASIKKVGRPENRNGGAAGPSGPTSRRATFRATYRPCVLGRASDLCIHLVGDTGIEPVASTVSR